LTFYFDVDLSIKIMTNGVIKKNQRFLAGKNVIANFRVRM
jgi:hypothetical protein